MIDEPNKTADELSNQNFDFLEEDEHSTSEQHSDPKNNTIDKNSINYQLYKKIAIGAAIGIGLAVIGWFITSSQGKLTENTLKPESGKSTNTSAADQAAAKSMVNNPPGIISNNQNLSNQNSDKVVVSTSQYPNNQSNQASATGQPNGETKLPTDSNFYSGTTYVSNKNIDTSKDPNWVKSVSTTDYGPVNPADHGIDLAKVNKTNIDPKSTNLTDSDKTSTNNNNPSNIANISGFDLKTNPTKTVQANQANHEYTDQQQQFTQFNQAITKLSQELNNNASQINELQNQLLELSKFIGNINNTISKLDGKILNLSTTINEMYSDIQNVKKYIQEEDVNLNTNLKPSEKDLFSHNPEYVIHAVIPGRAWLKSSSGQIITVAEGDQIGDYGRIAVIDPNNNIVRTSSGVVFR